MNKLHLSFPESLPVSTFTCTDSFSLSSGTWSQMCFSFCFFSSKNTRSSSEQGPSHMSNPVHTKAETEQSKNWSHSVSEVARPLLPQLLGLHRLPVRTSPSPKCVFSSMPCSSHQDHTDVPPPWNKTSGGSQTAKMALRVGSRNQNSLQKHQQQTCRAPDDGRPQGLLEGQSNPVKLAEIFELYGLRTLSNFAPI